MLGPWLTALRAQRPVITWAHALTVSGESVETSELLADPNPTWPAHEAVLTSAGLEQRRHGVPRLVDKVTVVLEEFPPSHRPTASAILPQASPWRGWNACLATCC